jgi:uncharacterized SAM-binding protein YcdF (DUF218 family)
LTDKKITPRGFRERHVSPSGYGQVFVSFKRITLWLILVSAVTLAILPAIFLSSGLPTLFIDWGLPLLSIERPLARADAILVLGGEPEARPLAAARLYRQGVAPLMFVIGEGDNAESISVLRESGVPAERIRVEPNSSSTLENALFSRPLLEAAGVRRALIVTSSFHTRRVLSTFQQRVPNIEFGVTGTRRQWWDTPRGHADENRGAALEFLKIPAYWLLYGVSPWVTEAQ